MKSIPPILAISPTTKGQDFVDKLCSYEYWAAPIELAVLPNTTFFPNENTYIVNGAYICDDLDYENVADKHNQMFLRDGDKIFLNDHYTEKLNNSKIINECAVILAPKFHWNYYHWHVEGLSQWTLIKDLGHVVGSIVVPDLDQSNFKRHTLQGIASSLPRLQSLGNQPIAFQRVAFLTNSVFDIYAHPASGPALVSLRDAAYEDLKIDRAAGRSPVYLTRLGAPARPMSNEQDLCTWLAGEGVRILNPSQLSFAEQMEILSTASCFISAHGAGFSNMVYIPDGVPVIELRALNAGSRSPLWDRNFQNLAASLGKPYACLLFDNADKSDSWSSDIGFVLHQLKSLNAI